MQHFLLVLFLSAACLVAEISCQLNQGERGLFPVIFNLAANARIDSNATCGENGRETYCKLVEHVPGEPAPNPQCRTCDAYSFDPREQHPIENAIDGTNSWWQSPSIANGMAYHYVTITLDLQQIFQVAYVIFKAANSPRPGNWILEKSINGINYSPWQYFAISDSECLSLYNIEPTVGNPHYDSDDDVICTSFYSKLNPLKNGEIHVSLVNGRPTVLNPSGTLMEFTSARFIRLRLQRVRTLHADLMTLTSNEPGFIDPLVTRRYFYSVKDISVGGQCICFGHASVCPQDPVTLALRCECEHNTCGDQCEECCPGFNQKAWRPGTQEDGNICEPCNCHGHATDCYFDQGVQDRGESLDIFGNHDGGGVCIDCRDNTMGVNCELCIDRYYRPIDVPRTDPDPCVPCNCNPYGIREVPGLAYGSCVKDDSQIDQGLNPGDCFCKEGYAGAQCDRCARGYQGFPNCEKCPCSTEGSVNEDVCIPPCVCKNNVEGAHCDICKPGHYNLEEENQLGCSTCFCFGVTTVCTSATVSTEKVQSLDRWVVGDKDGNGYYNTERTADDRITVRHPDAAQRIGSNMLYWYAPLEYLGNKIGTYGGSLTYTVGYNENPDANSSTPTLDSDVILRGNGINLKQRPSRWVVPDREETFEFSMMEDTWFHEDSERFVSKVEFMTLLQNVDALLIRASYFTSPLETRIHGVGLDYHVVDENSTESIGSIEQCQCPPGYEGLSCEDCIPGYRRVDGDVFEGQCVPCECNGHALECDDITGECLDCQHNTAGDHCELCSPGYYGDSTQGTSQDCTRCACPLTDASNNFSPTCIPDGSGGFICDYCDVGYEGPRCDRCSDGYYGNPLVLNDTCKPCMSICNNNLNLELEGNCNTLTGDCLRCAGNTAGPTCDRCADGYYGDAVYEKNCQLCQCYRTGSDSEICDHRTGQCQCKQFVTGQFCNICEPGYWDILSGKGCGPCLCNPQGSEGVECNIVTGQCFCKPGVIGRTCDQCQPGYFNFTANGCTLCDCDRTGGSCDSTTGECICPPNTVGRRCEQCAPNAWGHDKVTGCKLCNCSADGSQSLQCDINTGECDCQDDFRGQKCDQCLFGYRDFPKCRECKCDSVGTDPTSCNEDGLCGCQDDGQCQCKVNVVNKKCNKCHDDSFGFREELETGCTQCFCYGITTECDQADYVREEIVVTAATNGFFVSDDRSVFQTQSGVLFTPSEVRLNATYAQREMTTDSVLYWNLPPAFIGNKITSYGGRIRYTLQYFGDDLGEDDSFDILIKGHYHTIVKSLPNPFSGVPQSFDLELVETEWQLRDAILLETVPRDVFMMVLYDVQAIMIRATYGSEMTEAILSDLSLEVGIPRSDNPSLPDALGVEECVCPEGYQGLSCQECAPGYVRVSNGPYLGTCRPCTCNNHGSMCDPSTGICEDCQDNTRGPMCELCEDGYYGNATNGSPDDCEPCACPLVASSNNFSPTCVLESDGGHRCTNCQPGYTGRYCDVCEEGYYGNPKSAGEKCNLCDCNEFGSLDQICDPVTGQCVCDPGLTGRACDVCQPRHVLTLQGCNSCDDTCTGLLLDDIEELTARLETPNITGIVPAPWSRLRMLVNETEELKPQLESYKKALEVAAEMVNSLPDGVMGLQDDVSALLERSEESKSNAAEVAEDASDSDHRAIEVEQLLNETLYRIKALIQDLEDLADSISSQPAMENEALLDEAQRILDEILARDFSDEEQAADDELELAKEALEKARTSFMDKAEQNKALADRINGSITDLMDKFRELIEHSEQSQNISDHTEQMNNDNQNTLAELQGKMKSIMNGQSEVVGILDMGRQLLEDATDLLAQGYVELELTLVQADDLKLALPDLRMKVGLLHQNMADLPELVARAEAHADSLAAYAESLEELFRDTRDLAEIPVKAARVYGEIVETIDDANKTAHEAKMIADEALQRASEGTGSDDSLAERAMKSKERSETLLETAKTKESDVTSLKERLESVKQDVETIQTTSKEVADKNAAIEAELPALQTDLSQQAQDAKQRADEASGRAAAAKQKTQDVLDALPSQLEKFARLRDNTNQANLNLDSADRSLERSKDALGQLLDLTDTLTNKATAIRQLQGMMANNLTQIREKIALAKSQAGNVKLSVDTSGTCVRGYKPEVTPSFYSTLSMNFKTTQADNLLIYLGSAINDDFMSVETVGGNVKFQWDVGAGLGSVTHPAPVDDGKWYKFEANRYGSAGELVVRLSTSSTDGEVAKGQAPAGYSVLDVDPNGDLYIGGIPESYENNALSVKSFAGCVGETIIDGKNVGLYNFDKTEGTCDGCIESPGPTPSADTYQFDGSGYVVMPRIRKWNSRSTTITFNFRSFDENALLFYITDEQKDFMSIELNGGRVAYRYDLGGGMAELISPQKYNTGEWVRVSARRGKQRGILTLDGEDVADGQSPGSLEGLAINDFMYFGGTPSDIEVSNGVISRSFTGCLRDINVNLNAQDLRSENIGYVGVTDGCISKPIRNVGTMGSGYVEMPPVDLGVDGEITVSFATMQPNALILVGKDTTARRKRQINADVDGVYYSVMLNNGRVQVQLNAGDGEVLLTTRKSSGTFNDGEFHVASIVKSDQSIRLTIDDEHSRGGNLPSSNTEISVNQLFIGGVREDFQQEVGEAAEIVTPFAGCIQDLVFNGVLQDMATTLDFDLASLSHCMAPSEIEIPTPAPQPTAAVVTEKAEEIRQPTAPAVTQSGESCYRPSDPETLPGTVMFGRTKNSHQQYNIDKKGINKQFEIAVEVRSYASTGLIFYIGNGGDGKGDFTSLQLIDGFPVFSFDNGAGALTLTSQTQINDGEWHTIAVSRNRRTGTLSVDGGDEERGKAPDGASNMDIKIPLYVGGVEETIPVPRLGKVSNSLDSCIRKFELNAEMLDLQSPSSSTDVMPCYTTVENGAYFSGDGYAVLDETFRVGTDMVIELEFRTTQNNGVLMTVANERNDCFGLELVNGELTLRADNGAGKFDAVFTTESPYSLCDNEWHIVRANKVKNALELQVDGEYVGGGTDKISSSADTNNPLYIGGYPDTAIAQKALTISDKFQGCIRNVKIQDVLQDMSKAPVLFNVSPNSCPFV